MSTSDSGALRSASHGASGDESVAADYFARGDYTQAARHAVSAALRGCALIMLGDLERGLALLGNAATARDAYCRAIAFWGQGEPEAALDALKPAATDASWGTAAAKLSRFIAGEKIRILFQGRDDPDCPDYDIVGALRAIPYVDLKTVGYTLTSDVIVDYGSTLEDVLDDLPDGWTPDMWVCHMFEDNPPPVGIERATFPVFGHTQDYDRHFHQCQHYLKLFDGLIALGSADHADFSMLSESPVFVFPLLLGVDMADKPDSDGATKDLDVFVSGTIFSNIHEKSACLYNVSQMSDRYKVRLLDGYVSPESYYDGLAAAKATFTYVNRAGLVNGRAVEAISVGTCALYQEGGELGIFLSEEEGAIPYTPDNYLDVLAKVIDNWDAQYAGYAKAGMRKIPKIFEFKRCIRLYLHFLGAHVPLTPKRVAAPDPVFGHVRYPSRSPWRIRSHFRDTESILHLQDRFRRRLSGSIEYAHLDATGESFLYGAITIERSTKKTEEMVELQRNLYAAAFKTYQILVRIYPERIAAWFNLARIYHELRDYATASQIFTEILLHPEWHYAAEDLLFWKEFQPRSFDYDRMMAEIVLYRKTQDTSHLRAIERLMRESAMLYFAQILVMDGNDLGALEVLSSQACGGDISYPAALAMRAILRLGQGDAVGAHSDLRAAMQREGYVLATIDPEVVAQMKQHGLDVGDVEVSLQRLRARYTIAASSWDKHVVRTDGYLFAKDNIPLSTEEYQLARQTCDTVLQLAEGREAYVRAHGLSEKIYVPDGLWALDQPLYQGFRTVAAGNYDVLNNLRLFAQLFSGWSLIANNFAGNVPMPTCVPPDLEAQLAPRIAKVDHYATLASYAFSKLPRWMRVPTPRRFGEMGWTDGELLLSHDVFAYLERVILMYESGVLHELRRRAEQRPIRILEIGGGYGGLAHYIKRLIPNSRYVIIDLPESLMYSAPYLSVLFAGEQNLIAADHQALIDPGSPGFTFVSNHLALAVKHSGLDFDLAINTLSLSEMNEDQVRHYSRLVRKVTRHHGVFFEQNQDDREIGHLNAKDIVRDYFEYHLPCSTGVLHGITQGAANVWSHIKLDDWLESADGEADKQ